MRHPIHNDRMSVGTRSAPCRTRIIRSRDEAQTIREAWMTLRAQCGQNSPNSDYDWYRTTLETLGSSAQPYVVARESDGRLRSLIIGRYSRRRLPIPVGYLTAQTPRLRCMEIVYGGILDASTNDAPRSACRQLRDCLASGDVDVIVVNHLSEESDLFRLLTSDTANRNWRRYGRPQPHHQLAVSTAPPEGIVNARSKKHRYNLRRAWRLLAEECGGEPSLVRTSDPEALDEYLDDMTTLDGMSYQHLLHGRSNRVVHTALLRHAAQCGALCCYRLVCGDRAVAHLCGVCYGGRYHLLSTAYTPSLAAYSPGQLLLVRSIDDLRSRGIETFDFGFGDAAYKRAYASQSFNESTLLLFASTTRGRMARWIHDIVNAGVNRAERVASRCGQLASIKRQWRRRLTKRAAARALPVREART